MKKILLVKITSMGDLIQMLPALTDAQKAIPGIQFDWLAETSFQEIPYLHPAIQKVIALPYRQWQKNIYQALKTGEVKAFWQTLRADSYDMVIDAQSNIKSALVTTLARGKKFGLDRASVREYGAHFAYHKKISISRSLNHVQRMRQLMASFLNYPLPDSPLDYGISLQRLPELSFALPEKFIFLAHLASRKEKLWPEEFWQVLIKDLINEGYALVLPWWSKEEKERALRLQGGRSEVQILPPLDLTQKAKVLAQARAAVSLDTGLAHMAAALNIPNVTLYGAIDPAQVGAIGEGQIHLSATAPACAPCGRMHCSYEGGNFPYSPCLETIKPAAVLQALLSRVKP